MKKYTVISPFKSLAGIHKPGDPEVELNDADAAELIELGAVEVVAVPAEREGGDTVAGNPPASPLRGELTAEERLAAITTAIGSLDPDNGDLWLRDGRPDASALTEITGWTVSAAERNAAWAAMLSTSL